MVVIVAVDGERQPDPILMVGSELAERLGTELVALHVMPQARFERVRESRGGDREDPRAVGAYTTYGPWEPPTQPQENPYNVEVAQKHATDVARSVVAETLGDDADVVLQGRVGAVVDQLVREAERREAEYLVVGGRKRSAVGKAVFGSVTQSVLLEADRPVLTVPADGLSNERDGPVVAGVDRSGRAARVMAAADRLATAIGRPLHVVHVAPENDPGGLLDRDVPPDDEALRAAAADVAGEAAEGVADDYTSVGLVGEPSHQLLEYATAEDASYLVTAGRRRSPVGKVLFGSVTQSLLLGTDRPVLSVMVEE